MNERAVVVGAGIFGVTAAIALRARGLSVTLVDPALAPGAGPSNPSPHPLAESTDISKVVRLDYGADDAYLALMEAALYGWRRWNARWTEPLFHETGVAFLTRAPMAPGGFEHESYARLRQRGHLAERLDAAAIHERFPAWKAGVFVDGYFNPEGGWAESGRVVAALLAEAEVAGVRLAGRRTFDRLLERGSRVGGVLTREGGLIEAEHVIVAAGAWTGHLLPFLRGAFRSVGQPVFHLAPTEPALYAAERFPVFGADISGTGYYGFPVHRDGVVKIANHGVGSPVFPGHVERAEGDPLAAPDRVVSAEQVEALRAFLRDTFPGLVDAPIVKTRVCVYGDTWDEHFWIARDPGREGLTVAAGGSGHGFKFAPVLGDLIANATLGVPDRALEKFRWRPTQRPERGEEAARHHG